MMISINAYARIRITTGEWLKIVVTSASIRLWWSYVCQLSRIHSVHEERIGWIDSIKSRCERNWLTCGVSDIIETARSLSFLLSVSLLLFSRIAPLLAHVSRCSRSEMRYTVVGKPPIFHLWNCARSARVNREKCRRVFLAHFFRR